jgi:hypothetical protein
MRITATTTTTRAATSQPIRALRDMPLHPRKLRVRPCGRQSAGDSVGR